MQQTLAVPVQYDSNGSLVEIGAGMQVHERQKKTKTSDGAWAYIFARENQLALLNASILLIGYIAWYFSRVHISAASSYLIEDKIFTKDHYTLMTTIAYGVQLVFKTGSGFVMDYFNTAKFIFLFNGLLCVGFTLLNVVWPKPEGFVVSFAMIKAASAFARIACVKVLASWYPKEIFGTVGSFIQICSCLGELIARNVTCEILKRLPWKQVWAIGAIVTTIFLLPVAAFVQGRKPAEGSRVNMKQIFRESLRSFLPDRAAREQLKQRKAEQKQTEIAEQFEFSRDVFFPLMRSPKFWVLAGMSFTTNCITESMVSFGPHFFRNVLGIDGKTAGQYSSLSTVPAMVGIFVGGQLLDYLKPRQRPWIPVVLLVIACASFLGLLFFIRFEVQDPLIVGEAPWQQKVPIVMMLIVAWLAMAAPSSFLDGAYVVQLAGARGAAFAAGVVSGVGYLGASATSQGIRKLFTSYDGWIYIFVFFLGCGVLSLILSIVHAFICLREIAQEEREQRIAAALSINATMSNQDQPPQYSQKILPIQKI